MSNNTTEALYKSVVILDLWDLYTLYIHVHFMFMVCLWFLFFQEALTELEQLKQIVPKESLVYFLIGKV